MPEWISVLKLSTMWHFQKIREFAIQKMAPLVGVDEKVILAQKYRITEWLLPALDKWTQQSTSITHKDVDRMGLDFILKIVEARDQYMKSCSKCSNRDRHDYTNILSNLFQSELKDAGVKIVPVSVFGTRRA